MEGTTVNVAGQGASNAQPGKPVIVSNAPQAYGSLNSTADGRDLYSADDDISLTSGPIVVEHRVSR